MKKDTANTPKRTDYLKIITEAEQLEPNQLQVKIATSKERLKTLEIDLKYMKKSNTETSKVSSLFNQRDDLDQRIKDTIEKTIEASFKVQILEAVLNIKLHEEMVKNDLKIYSQHFVISKKVYEQSKNFLENARNTKSLNTLKQEQYENKFIALS